jgi:hypothetical protein
MALEYGADLVYTPEVVDKGIVGCERVVNGTFLSPLILSTLF